MVNTVIVIFHIHYEYTLSTFKYIHKLYFTFVDNII